MLHFTEFCSEILQKVAQMTSLRDEEPLVAAYFDILIGQFSELQSIALFKFERMHKESSLTLEAFQDKNNNNSNASGLASSRSDPATVELHDANMGLSKDIFEFLQQTILKNIKIDEYAESQSGQDFLIKKANQDKQISFFIVYQLSGLAAIELQKKAGFYLPLDKTTSSSIQLIRHLADIYRNHQVLISLNDKDALTGLYNRKFFDRKMNQLSLVSEHQLRRQKEIKNCNYLAMLDIDHFKRINDAYGHLYGDEVLLLFARQMQKFFRDEDYLFRYGGEEFVVILKNIDCTQVENVLHRFRVHIESYSFPNAVKITISIGVTLLDTDISQSETIHRADNALYYIKEHGRNNVGYYEHLIRDDLLQETITHDDIELF